MRSTVVEAIVQVLRTSPSSRVLVCAPSNSAADLLALRVLGPTGGRPKSEMLRVNAYQRSRADVPPELQEVSPYDAAADAHVLPSVAMLTKPLVRVVVCTCLMAAKVRAAEIRCQSTLPGDRKTERWGGVGGGIRHVLLMLLPLPWIPSPSPQRWAIGIHPPKSIQTHTPLGNFPH